MRTRIHPLISELDGTADQLGNDLADLISNKRFVVAERFMNFSRDGAHKLAVVCIRKRACHHTLGRGLRLGLGIQLANLASSRERHDARQVGEQVGLARLEILRGLDMSRGFAMISSRCSGV